MYKDMRNPVTRHPNIVSGAACFEGTRVPVKFLLDYLSGDGELAAFLESYPGVSKEQARQALDLAGELLELNARLIDQEEGKPDRLDTAA
jgi:uncharacterized protein (DUF433 family)